MNKQITLYSATDGGITSEREDPDITGQTGLLAFLRSPMQILNDPGGEGEEGPRKTNRKSEAREKAGGWLWGLESGHNSPCLSKVQELSRELRTGLFALPFKTNLLILVYRVLVHSFYMPMNTTPLQLYLANNL